MLYIDFEPLNVQFNLGLNLDTDTHTYIYICYFQDN